MVLALIALSAAVTRPAPDPRAEDAIAVFTQFCVGKFTGGKSDIDPSRFTRAQVPAETVKETRPELAGQIVWEVSGKVSGVHMLVHNEPLSSFEPAEDICVVEVDEASETAMRIEFAEFVEQKAKTLNAKVDRLKDFINKTQINTANYSSWRLNMAGRGIDLVVATCPKSVFYPESKPVFRIQHMMTISYASDVIIR